MSEKTSEAILKEIDKKIFIIKAGAGFGRVCLYSKKGRLSLFGILARSHLKKLKKHHGIAITEEDSLVIFKHLLEKADQGDAKCKRTLENLAKFGETLEEISEVVADLERQKRIIKARDAITFSIAGQDTHASGSMIKRFASYVRRN